MITIKQQKEAPIYLDEKSDKVLIGNSFGVNIPIEKRNIKLLISQLILLDNETTNKTNPL